MGDALARFEAALLAGTANKSRAAAFLKFVIGPAAAAWNAAHIDTM